MLPTGQKAKDSCMKTERIQTKCQIQNNDTAQYMTLVNEARRQGQFNIFFNLTICKMQFTYKTLFSVYYQ